MSQTVVPLVASLSKNQSENKAENKSNKKELILKIAILGPLYGLFDYLPPLTQSSESIPKGVRVRVPFGKRVAIGFVIDYGHSDMKAQQLKPILDILDTEPLFPHPTWNLLIQAHRYYHHSLGDVLQSGLPLALRKGKAVLSSSEYQSILSIPQCQSLPQTPVAKKSFILNAQQASALEQIQRASDHFACFLLSGITGSGKTEVYLQAIEKVRHDNKAILILIPEISLSPQTLARFEERFEEPIGLYHSQLTDKQRLRLWCAIKDKKINIIIGTRSALFLPIQNLGLIIIDEEHDASFKQQEGFRYCARNMAVLLAQQQNIPIVLGSATPSFESLYNVQQKKYTLLSLPYRTGDAQLPDIKLLDVRHKKLKGGLSSALIDQIKSHLENHNQVLIFLNRRGYAPAWMCFACGWFAQCKRCDARFTYHKNTQYLQCHHCEYKIRPPTACAQCTSTQVDALGAGTEKLEETLQSLFPNNTLLRIDKDTTARKGELTKKLQAITTGAAQILIGTQLLAKGHHFPNVTLVAIVDIDSGLFSTDFRAVERMGQLITQVAGRAGRAHKKGTVILQSYHPDNILIKKIIAGDYDSFSQMLLEQRAACHLPPFSHLALVRACARQAQLPEDFLTQIKAYLSSAVIGPLNIDILGPVPAPMARRKNYFHFQLLLQSANRHHLHQVLAAIRSDLIHSKLKNLAKKLLWSIDVDPMEMG